MILESCENPLPQLVEKLWQKQMESYTNPLLQLVEIESYGKNLLFAKENGKFWKSFETACGNWKLWQTLASSSGNGNEEQLVLRGKICKVFATNLL